MKSKINKEVVKKYKQLSKDEREYLCYLIKCKPNDSIRELSRIMNRSASTISRELRRNRNPIDSRYLYGIATIIKDKRRLEINKSRFTKILPQSRVERYIELKLKTDWSPEQISGRMKVDIESNIKIGFNSAERVSHKTIYRYIEERKPEWRQYLRFNRKDRRRRKYRTKMREREREKAKKRWIDTRPDIVEQRTRLGDWEGDTIIGGEKTKHILTNVDRASGYLCAEKLERATAEETNRMFVVMYQKIPKDKQKTLTLDNGNTFAKHESLEEKIGISIYFALPYHSWERGTNENTNGLLRQYYPKKSMFGNITKKDLDKKVKLINNRPRKRLGYLTPYEVFHGVAL